MTKHANTAQPKACSNGDKPALTWRGFECPVEMPMCEIPRQLAADLVRYLSPDHFIATLSEKELDENQHSVKWLAHKKRMDRLVEVVLCELCDQGLTVTDEVILRGLSIIYESQEVLRGVA